MSEKGSRGTLVDGAARHDLSTIHSGSGRWPGRSQVSEVGSFEEDEACRLGLAHHLNKDSARG